MCPFKGDYSDKYFIKMNTCFGDLGKDFWALSIPV